MLEGLSCLSDAQRIKQRRTLEKHPEVTYTIIPNGGEAAAAFGGIRSIPNSFMLDRQGRIVKQFVGLTAGDTLEGWVQALLREKS